MAQFKVAASPEGQQKDDALKKDEDCEETKRILFALLVGMARSGARGTRFVETCATLH